MSAYLQIAEAASTSDRSPRLNGAAPSFVPATSAKTVEGDASTVQEVYGAKNPVGGELMARNPEVYGPPGYPIIYSTPLASDGPTSTHLSSTLLQPSGLPASDWMQQLVAMGQAPECVPGSIDSAPTFPTRAEREAWGLHTTSMFFKAGGIAAAEQLLADQSEPRSSWPSEVLLSTRWSKEFTCEAQATLDDYSKQKYRDDKGVPTSDEAIVHRLRSDFRHVLIQAGFVTELVHPGMQARDWQTLRETFRDLTADHAIAARKDPETAYQFSVDAHSALLSRGLSFDPTRAALIKRSSIQRE